MDRLFNLIAQVVSSEAATTAKETLTVPPEGTQEVFLDPISTVLCVIGLCIWVIWLFWFEGFGALRKAPLRRHRRWFIHWPLAILFVWLLSMSIIMELVATCKGTDIQSLPDITQNLVNAVLQISLIAVMLFIAHKAFARRLNGFGLNIRVIHKDISFAIIYFLAVYPLIIFAFIATNFICQFTISDFEVQQHQMLEFLTENNDTVVAVIMVIIAVGIAPFFEEMLFRGFFQSSLRSVISPWGAIVLTSVFFAIIHYPNYTHMPSLFLLSCGMGYAYERSGSLLRPIFIHILFNGFNVVLTLLLSR